MKRFLLMSILLLSALASAQTISTNNYGGYNEQVLPGSVRRIFFTISGGTTNLVNYSTTTTGAASATLSCTSNCQPWVDITIGSTAGSCSISPASGSGTGATYTLSSTATVTLTGQSAENTASTVSLVLDVCAKTTTVYAAPFYIVLYANQPEDFQSWVIGNTNQNVTWSITSQPAGGDGALSDTGNRDTVFHATVAGDYVLTATSVADGTKTQTVTAYVTGHTQPSWSTNWKGPNNTQVVDCTVDPAMTGTTYDVGPSQTYTTINAALTAIHNAAAYTGVTVRVHNEDTTGSNPTTYHEYIQLDGSGTHTQPYRLCGVPDSTGHLPVLDENLSTGATWESVYAAVNYGGVSLHIANSGPQYVIVEGLKIEHTYLAYNYYPMTALLGGSYTSGGSVVGTVGQNCDWTASGYPNATGTVALTGTNVIASGTSLTITAQGNAFSTAPTSVTLSNGTANCSGTATVSTATGQGSAVAWQAGAEGINDRDGAYHVLRGNDLESNDDGVFTEFNGNSAGWSANKISDDIEGNYFTGNGNGLAHQLYLQGWLELIQFNTVAAGRTGVTGYSQLKCRGLDDVIRYNQFLDSGQSGGRHLDMPDQEDASNWIFPYVGNSGYGYVSEWAGGDTKGLDWAAAWWEAWQSTFLYGNLIVDTSDAQYPVHYLGDHGFSYQERQGSLYFYDNTTQSYSDLFDLDDNSGGAPPTFPQVQVQNNVIWDTGTSGGCWNRSAIAMLGFTTNQVNAGLADFTTPIPTTWTCNGSNHYAGSGSSATGFTNMTPVNGQFTGWSSANIVSSATQPYDSNYQPLSGHTLNGTSLSGAMAAMPVRYQFGPTTGYYDARSTPVTSSAGGIAGALDSSGPPPPSANTPPQLLLFQ